MNTTWWVILGVLLAGAAVFLLLPHVLPDRKALEEQPVVVEAEPSAETEVAVPAPVEPAEEAAVSAAEPVEPASASEDAEETRVVVVYSIDGDIGAEEYPHMAEIAGVEVYWANDATYLRVGLVAPGTGYVSIGFDPVRRMEGANFIIGYVEDGVGYFRDDFGTEPTVHMADVDRGGMDHIVSSAGSEWVDRTILEFMIPLDSGDESDKLLIPGNTYTVLLAYHDLQDGFTTRHSRRGSGEIRLDPAP